MNIVDSVTQTLAVRLAREAPGHILHVARDAYDGFRIRVRSADGVVFKAHITEEELDELPIAVERAFDSIKAQVWLHARHGLVAATAGQWRRFPCSSAIGVEA